MGSRNRGNQQPTPAPTDPRTDPALSPTTDRDPSAMLATIEAQEQQINTLTAELAALEPDENANRFLAHFPIENVKFRDNVRNPDKPWNDGTISQTLAVAALELGTTGSFIPGARIVVKTLPNGGGKRFDLQLPSSGQQFRHPMLEVNGDEGAKLDFEDWKKLVVAAWMADRKRKVAAGAATIKGLTPTLGVAADDAMLRDLGVLVSDMAPTP